MALMIFAVEFMESTECAAIFEVCSLATCVCECERERREGPDAHAPAGAKETIRSWYGIRATKENIRLTQQGNFLFDTEV